MAGFNQVTLVGNICKDPEVRYSAGGTEIANFQLAVNEGKGDAQFFRIVSFDKTAAFAAQYLRKGTPILVAGRLQTRKWQANDGQNREVTEIVANQLRFVGPKPQLLDTETGEPLGEMPDLAGEQIPEGA